MATVLPSGLKIWDASDLVTKDFWNFNTTIIDQHIQNGGSGGGVSVPLTLDGSTLASGYALTVKPTQSGSALWIASGSLDIGEITFARNAAGILVIKRLDQDYTLLQINAPPPAMGSNEATMCLRCDGATSADQHFVDFYNEEYADERQCGIRIQKRGSMTQKDFVIDFYDGQTPAPLYKLQAMIIKPNGTVQIPVKLDLGKTALIRANASPDVPDDGNAVTLFGKKVSGRTMPAIMEYTWRDKLLKTHDAFTRTIVYYPGAAAVVGAMLGCPVATTGTISHPIASTNFSTSLHRTRVASATTAGAGASIRGTLATIWRGNGGGRGGFFAVFRFSIGTNSGGTSLFVGLNNLTTALDGDVSALLNIIGVGYDTADNPADNLYLFMNDGTGTATKIDTGCPRAVGAVYTLSMFCVPNGSSITVSLEEASAGTTYLDSVVYTTDLPVNTAFLAPHCDGWNGTTTVSVQPELAKLFIESDY